MVVEWSWVQRNVGWRTDYHFVCDELWPAVREMTYSAPSWGLITAQLIVLRALKFST